uniref:Uncharacterized protein n=1 Tax=Leptobrachium leishanense TaxID=445787 RepID=A0A8C5WCU1_9ANUR
MESCNLYLKSKAWTKRELGSSCKNSGGTMFPHVPCLCRVYSVYLSGVGDVCALGSTGVSVEDVANMQHTGKKLLLDPRWRQISPWIKKLLPTY